jgi:hypothetical protein
MANLPWLDEVRKRLAQSNLPPTYIWRFMEELSDHFQDITEETMSTEANVLSRLGDPNQLAEAAIDSYRRHSFLGRHPTAAFVVFAISPLVSLIILSGLCMAGMWFSDEALKWMGVNTEQCLRSLKRFDPAATVIMPYLMSLLIVVIPSILVSIFYCRFAKRLGIGRKWIIVSCVVLAATALMPICSAELSDVPGKSRLMVGAWNPFRIEYLLGTLVHCFCNPRQMLQFIVPLAIGVWYIRRKRDQDQLQLAS